MNILIDSKLIVQHLDLSDDEVKFSSDLNLLFNLDEVNLWIDALGCLKVNEHISMHGEKYASEKIINDIFSKFSIIPLRGPIIKDYLLKGKKETQLIVSSAENFLIEYIITDDAQHYGNSNIPVIELKEFLSKFTDSALEEIHNVSFLDLKAQHHQIYNEIDDRITQIIVNTEFILGRHVAEFEEKFAALHNVKYCLGVSTGTDALHIALMALGVGMGDEVIVPVNTFIATAEAVSLVGATPVFIDCNEYFNIDHEKIREYIETANKNNKALPKAIIPVHLYGQPANMSEITKISEEFNIPIVEDSCQAHLAEWKGEKVGNFGKFAAFSFYPGKNLGAYGEAGAVLTNDEELFQSAKLYRQHGEIKRYHHKVVGHNYRMEAIQGAVLAVKLKYLEGWTRHRQENAKLYSELLSDVDAIQTPKVHPDASSVYHLYVIESDERDALQNYLTDNGISTGLHYPIPLHLQPAYEYLGVQSSSFPMAEKMAKRILSLPMYPELKEKQIQHICNHIRTFLNRN